MKHGALPLVNKNSGFPLACWIWKAFLTDCWKLRPTRRGSGFFYHPYIIEWEWLLVRLIILNACVMFIIIFVLMCGIIMSVLMSLSTCFTHWFICLGFSYGNCSTVCIKSSLDVVILSIGVCCSVPYSIPMHALAHGFLFISFCLIQEQWVNYWRIRDPGLWKYYEYF